MTAIRTLLQVTGRLSSDRTDLGHTSDAGILMRRHCRTIDVFYPTEKIRA